MKTKESPERSLAHQVGWILVPGLVPLVLAFIALLQSNFQINLLVEILVVVYVLNSLRFAKLCYEYEHHAWEQVFPPDNTDATTVFFAVVTVGPGILPAFIALALP
jgi:hypothetical protein